MTINYDPITGLVPAIIQDDATDKVLMLGYMNAEAFAKTIETKLVCFYSRSKQRLWTKGETSGNYLHVVSIKNDCDQDSLLIQVTPSGPTCHTGADTCWDEKNKNHLSFLSSLEHVIASRRVEKPEDSYVASLFHKGINKIAQKVGEEAVELVIEAKDDDLDLFKDEAADLLFHYLILLQAKEVKLEDIVHVLEARS